MTQEIEIFPDTASLVDAAAELIVRLAHKVIGDGRRFSLVLAGGSTPKALYEQLASGVYQERLAWSQIDIFFGDERCVPADDPQSNFRMVNEAMLKYVPIPKVNIYAIEGDVEPHEAAQKYEDKVRAYFGDGEPRFDLVLLGMGEDGHTASLFPMTAAIHEQKQWVVAQYVEKLSDWRVTLTPVILNNAAHTVFFVAGETKAEALKAVLQGEKQVDSLPSQVIQPKDGNLSWYVDRAAASLLDA